MRFLFFPALLVGVPFAAGAPRAAPTVHPELVARGFLGPRGVCESDDLLRDLRKPSNKAQATPFCRSLLASELATSTVATVTASNEYVTATEVVTSTRVESATITSIETFLSTATSTITVSTLTEFEQWHMPGARDVDPYVALSESLFQNYPETQIISACACISIPICYRKATKTIAGLTETLSTATSFVYETSTATTTTFTTTTDISTATESATATTTLPPSPSETSFRIRTLNAAGQVAYMKRSYHNAIGNVFYQTTDVTQAALFVTDSLGRLTIDSPQYSDVALMYTSTQWNWNAGTFNAVAFKPASMVDTTSQLSYWAMDVDGETGALVPSPVNGVTPIWQACQGGADGGLFPIWGSGAVLVSGCHAIQPTIEFVV
ncbi:hypothetical protein QBC34DRAFT_470119 [Podospora aff. communis PSN243]|uniref:Uncharacterized protein n=1 Tax=Podospora aff. communis PSN243 TaxID=3040156 RepID=A0AAV9GDR0_9PEZI|nr:hypothetical protein QBC34DRAFT_470119 [Podospora aff. communis PSN243]